MKKIIYMAMILFVLLPSINVKAAEYPEYRPDAPVPERPHLTKSGGVFAGPSGKETWYDLPMGRVIQNMRELGYDEFDYPFYVREDGAKCIGEYVLVAMNTYQYPKGTIVETSLGQGIVADHCVRAESENVIDVATDWY